MKTYLVYLLVCSSLNATDCKPLTLTSVSGAHTANQAVQIAVRLASECKAPAAYDDDAEEVATLCATGFIKLDKVELAP